MRNIFCGQILLADNLLISSVKKKHFIHKVLTAAKNDEDNLIRDFTQN